MGLFLVRLPFIHVKITVPQNGRFARRVRMYFKAHGPSWTLARRAPVEAQVALVTASSS